MGPRWRVGKASTMFFIVKRTKLFKESIQILLVPKAVNVKLCGVGADNGVDGYELLCGNDGANH